MVRAPAKGRNTAPEGSRRCVQSDKLILLNEKPSPVLFRGIEGISRGVPIVGQQNQTLDPLTFALAKAGPKPYCA